MGINSGDKIGEDFEDNSYLLKKLSSIFKILSKENKKTKDEILEIIQKNNFYLFQIIKENEGEFNSYLSLPIIEDDYKIYKDYKDGKENFGIYNLWYRIFDCDNNNFIYEDDMDINNKNENDSKNLKYYIDKQYKLNDKLNDKDNEIINRIKELGNFDKDEVIQAYFAYNKNEELTANYLFEQMNKF